MIAFEPALQPFGRSWIIFRVNETRFVLSFQAAVANATAFRSFFEPKDHLFNGSLIAQFAGFFGPNSEKRPSLLSAGDELDYFFRTPVRVLVKIIVRATSPI